MHFVSQEYRHNAESKALGVLIGMCRPLLDEEMRIFVRTLTGKTISATLSSVDEVKTIVQESEGIPPEEQRLIFAGRQLEDGRSLHECGVGEGSTVCLVLGGKRCTHAGCKARALGIVGTCRFCGGSFCGDHRLPEGHSCANMDACKQENRDKLAKKLYSEKVADNKFER